MSNVSKKSTGKSTMSACDNTDEIKFFICVEEKSRLHGQLSPPVDEAFASDINGLYNQFWPLNGRTLSPDELTTATTSIVRIAKGITKTCGSEFMSWAKYMAAASVCGLVHANSHSTTLPLTPLLSRLSDLETAIVKLGRKVCRRCPTCVWKKAKKTRTKPKKMSELERLRVQSAARNSRQAKNFVEAVSIMFSFARTLDPNEIDVNAGDANALFQIIQNLSNTGLYKLCTCRPISQLTRRRSANKSKRVARARKQSPKNKRVVRTDRPTVPKRVRKAGRRKTHTGT